MMDVKDWITAGLAVISIGLSLWVWYSTAALQRRGMHAGSMTDYQRVLFEINAAMLQYPAVGRVFEAGRLAQGEAHTAQPNAATPSVTSLAQCLQDDDSFRLRLFVLYHLNLLELVYEYYRGPAPLSDSEMAVRDSWQLWSQWLISGNRHVRSYVTAQEFAQTYNPHFVAHAREQAAMKA